VETPQHLTGYRLGMHTRLLGDREVSCVGLGCMPLSFPEHCDDRDRGIAVIHRALDLGITLLDTANIYAPAWNAVGHNEALVGEALRTYAGPADLDSVVVATKGGITRGPGETREGTWGRDARPDALLRAAEASVTALGAGRIDLYQLHRHDPSMTYRDQIQSLAAVKDAGLAGMIGLSNVTLPELELALAEIGGPREGGIVSVQNEWSPRYRGESDVLAACAEHDIAFLPWSPLGGSIDAHVVGSQYAEFAEVAQAVGVTAQEVVLAWLLQSSPVMIPIPGATKTTTVDSIVAATSVLLTPAQVALLDATVPLAESVYPEDQPRSPLR
jgi:aryl-alcohol dehydrogenase-like predicted oxidoreductase